MPRLRQEAATCRAVAGWLTSTKTRCPRRLLKRSSGCSLESLTDDAGACGAAGCVPPACDMHASVPAADSCWIDGVPAAPRLWFRICDRAAASGEMNALCRDAFEAWTRELLTAAASLAAGSSCAFSATPARASLQPPWSCSCSAVLSDKSGMLLLSLPSSVQTASMTKWKVDPLPGSLSTQILPPINSASRRQMARPIPVPPYRRVMVSDTCLKC
mmetsp:Transcript_346/g.906  ORF Transcript_346/g.906 Transcript_346/m.906 type:complete len:216 (+) Transcript_346:1821-2468(+)